MRNTLLLAFLLAGAMARAEELIDELETSFTPFADRKPVSLAPLAKTDAYFLHQVGGTLTYTDRASGTLTVLLRTGWKRSPKRTQHKIHTRIVSAVADAERAYVLVQHDELRHERLYLYVFWLADGTFLEDYNITERNAHAGQLVSETLKDAQGQPLPLALIPNGVSFGTMRLTYKGRAAEGQPERVKVQPLP